MNMLSYAALIVASTTAAFTVIGGIALVVIGAAQVWIAEKQNALAGRQADAAEAQRDLAEKQTDAALRQAEAAEAQTRLARLQIDRELAAYLSVIQDGYSSSDVGTHFNVTVVNGGSYRATNVRLWFEDESASALGETTYVPLIVPSQKLELVLFVPQAITRTRSIAVKYTWSDGLGEQSGETRFHA